MIFPLKSLVLADDFCASHALRPSRSSLGLYPLEPCGLVLSPVDKYRFPDLSQATDPPVWQHSSRWVGTSNSIFLEAKTSSSPRSSYRVRIFLEASGAE